MTDITELAQSLKAAAEKATPGRIGDRIDGSGSIKYQCFGNEGSLVLQTDHKNMEYGFIGPNSNADELFFRMCSPENILALVEELEKAQRYIEELREWNAGLAQESCEREQRIFELENQLKTAENNEIDARCRIAELEESHAQTIQSRDHYKRMSEEVLKRLAESRTVTVKQPAPVAPEEMPCGGAADDYHDGYQDGWNACRAAMLEAEPVTTANKSGNSPAQSPIDHGYRPGCECSGCKTTVRICAELAGWIPVSERMPGRYYVLAADFSGRHYPPSQPNTQVGIHDDWFGDGKPTWDDGDGNDLHLKQVTHWMPLPAAPQEVK